MGRTVDIFREAFRVCVLNSGIQSQFSLKRNHMWSFTHSQARCLERNQVTLFFGEGNLNIMKTRLVKENTTHTRQAHFQLFETTKRDTLPVFSNGSRLACARSQSGGYAGTAGGRRQALS